MKDTSWIRMPLVEDITIDFVDGRRKLLSENEELCISPEAIYLKQIEEGKEILTIFPMISVLSIYVVKL